MPHSTHFEPTSGGLVMTTAILLYQNEGEQRAPREGAPAFASIHRVEHRDGQPTIGVGAPLSRGQLRRWTDALGKAAAPAILPPNVLVSHPDVLAWWVPERVRPAYFALSNPPADLKALAQRTTVPVPYPAHLFVATRAGLGVYALPSNERPTGESGLLYSPILNVFVSGQLCWGNIARPKSLTTAAIAEFERAVFDSWSTHQNPGQERTVTGKGGLVRLWDDLAARGAQRFPVKRLKPFPATLGKLIAGGVR